MAKKKSQSRGNSRPAKKSAKAKSDVVAVPIQRELPPNQVGVLSNHFVIQHDGPEFHLLFFQTHPPIVLGETDEERRKVLEETKAVRSVCVARIIVSAERLPSFICAMQENLEKHGRQHGEAGAEKGQTTNGT